MSSIETTARANFENLKNDFSDLKSELKEIQLAIEKLDEKQISSFLKSNSVKIRNLDLTKQHIVVNRKAKSKQDLTMGSEGETVIVIDAKETQDLLDEGTAREVCNRVQKLRKKAGISETDPIEVFYSLKQPNGKLSRVILSQKTFITKKLGVPMHPVQDMPESHTLIYAKDFEFENEFFSITLTRRSNVLKRSSLKNVDDQALKQITLMVSTQDLFNDSKHAKFKFNGKTYELELGVNVFPSVEDMHNSSKQ